MQGDFFTVQGLEEKLDTREVSKFSYSFIFQRFRQVMQLMFLQIPSILFQILGTHSHTHTYIYKHLVPIIAYILFRSHKRYIRYSADSFLPHVPSRIRGCLARQLSRQIIRVAVVKMLRGI